VSRVSEITLLFDNKCVWEFFIASIEEKKLQIFFTKNVLKLRQLFSSFLALLLLKKVNIPTGEK
jgi:hypothetical protein